MPDDPLYLWINRSDEALRSAASFEPFFARLNASFLPFQSRLQVGNHKPVEIENYHAKALTKALDRGDINITLTSPDGKCKTLIWPLDNRTAISMYFEPGPTEEVRKSFTDLAEIVRPDYARCHFYSVMENLNKNYYTRRRTFYASGFYWLNFFGPEEEARQGGQALANNPFAKVTRFPCGVLLEVCSSPQEAATPEGVQKLVQATAAMPPLPGESVDPNASGIEGSATFPMQTDEVTLAGQRGFYDKGTRSFWVTKNLVPASSVDPQTVAKLLKVKQSPEHQVDQVNVLFSLKEAAEQNKSVLQASGIGAWYVNPLTGTPEKI